MCYYIGLENLVANAFIELLEQNESQRKVKFSTIEDYGDAVVQVLHQNGQDAILILSRENTRGFIVNCSRYFEVVNPDSPDGYIHLKDEFNAEDLAKEFCGGIAVDVLKALLSKDSLKVLQAA